MKNCLNYPLNHPIAATKTAAIRLIAIIGMSVVAHPVLAVCSAGSSSVRYAATDLPRSIGPNRGTTTNSTINVPDNFVVEDVNVLNVVGNHTYMADLRFRLIHNTTNRRLFGYSCGSQNNFSFSFDDNSTTFPPCPPTDGGIHRPTQTLSAFNGASSQGNWTLSIFDRFNRDGGQLRQWEIEICYSVDLDFGDAPDTSAGTGPGNYQTLSANGGPSHQVVSGLFLGSGVSVDTDGFGDGTDSSGSASDDDDDGIVALPDLPGNSSVYTLPATAISLVNTTGSTATLYAYIDFNGDGDYIDAGESTSQAVNNGSTNPNADLTWNGFTATASGPVYARFRLSNQPGLGPNGFATSGEVEDYQLQIIEPTYAISGAVFDDFNVNGNPDLAEPGLPDVTVVLESLSDGSCVATKTLGDGSYSFSGLSTGNYRVIESAAQPVPFSAACPPGEYDPANYLSVSPNTLTVAVVNTDLVSNNFSDVRLPVFEGQNTVTVSPGGTTSLPHVFTSYAAGTVSFSNSNQLADPLVNGWSDVLYRDLNCNGRLDNGEATVTGSIAVSQNQQICLVNNIFAPSNATTGAQFSLTINSNLTYADPNGLAHALVDSQSLQNLIVLGGSSSGRLSLVKEVQNLTQGGFDTRSNVAVPGDELRYTVSYENAGDGELTELVVNDSTPTYSTLSVPVVCPANMPADIVGCSVTNPAGGANVAGYSGPIQWVFTGTMLSGARGSVNYDVRVD